jgi:hypothetical protein
MYLKIMGAENAPDDDSRVCFRILDDVTAVNFERIVAPKDEHKPENRLIANRGPKAEVTFRAAPGAPPYTETFWPEGNCYLMNENGRTIATFGVAPFHDGRGDGRSRRALQQE